MFPLIVEFSIVSGAYALIAPACLAVLFVIVSPTRASADCVSIAPPKSFSTLPPVSVSPEISLPALNELGMLKMRRCFRR